MIAESGFPRLLAFFVDRCIIVSHYVRGTVLLDHQLLYIMFLL